MADLMKEYIDTKDIRYKVEHQVVSTDDRKSAEQIKYIFKVYAQENASL